MEPPLTFTRLYPNAVAPQHAYGESAAWDLSAFTLTPEGRTRTLTLPPRSTILVSTGLALRAPSGSVVLICSRSGTASRSIFVTNAPGVVDPDYGGEIKVHLFNGSMEPYYVQHGDRIAQALILPLTVCALTESSQLELSLSTAERPEAVHSGQGLHALRG